MYKRPKISEINQHEFERLYTIDGTIRAVECTLNDTCMYSARQGISLNDIKGTKLFKTITDCFCSPQKEINSIVETRNNFSHITDITEEEFKKCWSTLRDNIKKIETLTESKLWTEESIDKLEQKLDLKNLLQEIKTDLGKSMWNEKHSHEILEQMKKELKNLFQKSRENNPVQSFTSLSHENYTEASICLHPKQLKLKLKKLYKENDCGTEEAEKRLKENCRNLNLTFRNESPRDGNCFFDAVSSQLRDLGLMERSAQEIRENVIDYLMENKTFQGVDGDVNIEHFIDDSTFEDWASNMRKNRVFADHVVVLGMARMLETNMLIVTSNPQASPENCMTHIVGKMNYDGMTINLGHVWENHYYSLISLDATRENGRLVECCKMQSLNHIYRHSPLGICTTALKKMELDTPPSNYEVTSVDIYMTLKDRTITREMKIEGKGEICAPDVREIEIPCSSSISPMSYDNGDGDSDCDDDLFGCGKCGKRFTTYESFEKHKKESIQCNPRKRKNIKKPIDTLGMSSEQKQNMTPGEPNEKRFRLKIRMQQTPGEMEPAWKQYVKQVQKTCTGNLDVGEEFIVEHIEEGSLVFWTKTNSSTIKNKAKFAEIMDRFMVNLFQKCPIDTEDETKFSFSVDVVEAAEDEDTDDEDENDVFICGRCGITFKSFSSFTSHKRNINLCCKKKRIDQQHKNKKIDVEICLPCAPTPVVQEVGQASGKEDTGDTPTEFVIEVRGMKPTTSEDTLRYYFESRRGANADVVKMEFIEEKEMYMVWFEDESAIEAVMSKNLRVDGQTLKAKRCVPPPPQKLVPKYDDKVFITNISPTTTEDGLENFLEVKSECIPKESIFGEAEGTALVTFEQPPDTVREIEQSINMIKVSNIPDGSSEDCIELFFDNKQKSGGGDILKLVYYEASHTAIITFKENDVAKRVISRTPLFFEKKKIDVEICLPCAPTPVVQEVGQASGKEDTGDTPTEFVMEVRGMKPTTSEDTLRYYFESRKVANAEVVKMKFIEEKEMYMVWFEDESAIEAVMSKNLRVDGQTLKAKRCVPRTPQKPVSKYDDKVFITNISPTTTKDGLENFLEVKSGCIPKEPIFDEAEGTALVTFDQPPGSDPSILSEESRDVTTPSKVVFSSTQDNLKDKSNDSKVLNSHKKDHSLSDSSLNPVVTPLSHNVEYTEMPKLADSAEKVLPDNSKTPSYFTFSCSISGYRLDSQYSAYKSQKDTRSPYSSSSSLGSNRMSPEMAKVMSPVQRTSISSNSEFGLIPPQPLVYNRANRNVTNSVNSSLINRHSVLDGTQYPTGDPKLDGEYYLNVTKTEAVHLVSLCRQIETDLYWEDIPEDASGKIRAAVGKANLLVNQQFKQFEELCYEHMNPTVDGKLLKWEDLQGFWKMIKIQVDNVEEMFTELELIRQNGWKELCMHSRESSISSSPKSVSNASTPAGTSGSRRRVSKTKETPESSPERTERLKLAKARDDARKKMMAEKRAAMKKKQ